MGATKKYKTAVFSGWGGQALGAPQTAGKLLWRRRLWRDLSGIGVEVSLVKEEEELCGWSFGGEGGAGGKSEEVWVS